MTPDQIAVLKIRLKYGTIALGIAALLVAGGYLATPLFVSLFSVVFGAI